MKCSMNYIVLSSMYVNDFTYFLIDIDRYLS